MCDQVIDIGEHLRGGSGKLFGSRDVTRRDFRQEQAPESLVELDVRVSAKGVGFIENRYVQSEYGACGSAAALTQRSGTSEGKVMTGLRPSICRNESEPV